MFDIEIKYLTLANIKIKRVSSTVNISCPVCNEGKSKWKSRGYVLKSRGDITAVYCCQNECGAMSFYDMLMNVNPTLASGYIQEVKKDKLKNFKKSELSAFNTEVVEIKEEPIPDLIVIDSEVYDLSPLNDKALDYLLNQRKLPVNAMKYFRYIKSLDAIVALFLTSNNRFYGYQLRYLEEKQFHIHLFDDNPKIWNLFSIDRSKPVYVFESIIDALSSGLDNVISILGASLSMTTIKQWLDGVDLIFCLDNDKEGISKSIKYTSLGFKSLIHDDAFPSKDFNAALVDYNIKPEQIKNYILSNVHSPKLANMKLRLKS